MTDEEAAAIRERVETATPGPWKATIFRDSSGPFAHDVSGPRGTVATFLPSGPHEPHEVDLVFIAASREDIPALLDERAALLALLRSLVDDIDHEAWVWGWQTDLDAVRALLAGKGETQP